MIVRLCGGLCNTMFQYAFGRALETKRNVPVQFRWRDDRQPYTLEPYNVCPNLITSIYNPPIYREKTFAFDSEAFNQPIGTYFDGCWQTARYFEDIQDSIRQELTLKESVRPEVQRVADRIRESNSCFLHVRRGDYLVSWNSEYHGVLGLDYYTRAVDYIRQRVIGCRFFVFSDDPKYCSEIFPEYEVVSTLGFNRYEDLLLMSECRHSILANSSYSWFGAYLQEKPAKHVVAPKNWFNKANLDTKDLIPARWATL